MSKELRICGCGCIHFLDQDVIHNAITQDKNLLFICGQCGQATMIGADRVPNWYKKTESDPDECFDMYSYDVGGHCDMSIFDANSFNDSDGHKPIDKIIYDKGHVVMMGTGYRANYFSYDTGFEDMSYPDFIYHLYPEKTVPEIVALIEEFNKKRKTVWMGSLIRELTDEENDLLARSRIKGIDYTGTKWESRHG